MDEKDLRAVTIGEPTPLSGKIELADYDPAWPALFDLAAARIRAALGDRVLLLEHVGSTSVPGLAAKPRVDILLAVADSSAEPAYIPWLEATGYSLRIREPHWHEHRMLVRHDLAEPAENLHVFSLGGPEIDRMLRFRDWLRTHDDDRDLYARTKRDLARRDWQYTQEYADAKTAVVEEILARAR